MQTPSPSSTIPLLLLPKQRPTAKPAPQTTILHLCDMKSIFFLMIGKSNNLFVTKRKGELNRADGSLSLFLAKIKLNGF